jgi:hypothetical protein
MDFVRDYLGILPGIIAVVNGALAALLSHYPFKTPAGKLRFIVIVGLLSFAAVGATIYSQHLIVAQRNEERAQRDIIREKLGTFIEEGTRLMNQCRDSSKPPPVDAINEGCRECTRFSLRVWGNHTSPGSMIQAGFPLKDLLGSTMSIKTLGLQFFSGCSGLSNSAKSFRISCLY